MSEFVLVHTYGGKSGWMKLLNLVMCKKNTTTICNTVFLADEDDYYPLHDYSVIIPIGHSLKCSKLNHTDDSSVEENETLNSITS